MDSDYEKRLEAEIDAVLKSLPEMSAPRLMSKRVLAAIERRAALPWYRQSWLAWPAAVQAISLALLLAMFGGLCLGTWELLHGATFAVALQKAGAFFAPVSVLWSALNTLMSAVVLVAKSIGTWWLVGGVAVVGLGYGMCVALGTVYLRVGLARR
jgi:hypothetical protein